MWGYAWCLEPQIKASIEHQIPTQILARSEPRAGLLQRMSNILGILGELLLTGMDGSNKFEWVKRTHVPLVERVLRLCA